MDYLIVLLGAGIGGAMRHGVNLAAMRLGITAFPAATMTVNVAGSFAMGLIASYLALKGHLPQAWRLFLTTGILGGFTTFSTFSLDAAMLYERGKPMLAAAYAIGSVLLSIGALFAAMALVRAVIKG